MQVLLIHHQVKIGPPLIPTQQVQIYNGLIKQLQVIIHIKPQNLDKQQLVKHIVQVKYIMINHK